MKTAIFETDLSDAQWAFIEPTLPPIQKRGRPPTDRRRVLNAILYIVKGGIQWRLLPPNFPPWKTVHSIFRKWTKSHTWTSINSRLRAYVREQHGKDCRPKAAVLDSQSVKSDPHGGEVGYDAAKRIKGRKRHVLVDTLGLVLAVRVTPADVPEREGAKELLRDALPFLTWLRKIWVDGGYSGADLAQWVREHRPKAEVEVVKRSDKAEGFQPLPKRWIVERTLAWLMQNRRLVRDYERCESSAESWIIIALIRVQIRRLA